jgi:hypothetical protein
VSAAQALLDRGWGKPAQPYTGEDDKDIRITIRQIVEGGDKDRRRSAVQRIGRAAAQGACGGILTVAIYPDLRMPRAASPFCPLVDRRNCPNAHAARATKRMPQVSRPPNGEDQRLAVVSSGQLPAALAGRRR